MCKVEEYAYVCIYRHLISTWTTPSPWDNCRATLQSSSAIWHRKQKQNHRLAGTWDFGPQRSPKYVRRYVVRHLELNPSWLDWSCLDSLFVPALDSSATARRSVPKNRLDFGTRFLLSYTEQTLIQRLFQSDTTSKRQSLPSANPRGLRTATNWPTVLAAKRPFRKSISAVLPTALRHRWMILQHKLFSNIAL